VRIIARKTLQSFWKRRGCADAEQPLLAWFREVEEARWKGPADVRKLYGSADFVANNRVIFNIGGNKYRLVVAIKYSAGIVFIRFVGTHAEYDKIDPAVI
jgi:mRNA interferase HigB